MSDTASLTVILAGDYNQNGIVDAADYTVWRNNLRREHRADQRRPRPDARLGHRRGLRPVEVPLRRNGRQRLGRSLALPGWRAGTGEFTAAFDRRRASLRAVAERGAAEPAVTTNHPTRHNVVRRCAMLRSNMKTSNLFLVAVFVLGGPLAVPSAGIDIQFVLDDEDENPALDPDGSILLSMFEAAASYWEPIFPYPSTYTVDVGWDNDIGGLGLWSYDPVGNNNIEINSNQPQWWADPTPLDHSEYDFTVKDRFWDVDSNEWVYLGGQWLYQDMNPANWFNGAAPELLEIGYRGNATSGGDADGKMDLLSTCIHELGHELGIRGGDFDLYAHFIGGITGVQVKEGPGNHIAPRSALMCNSCGVLGVRRLPSAVDILALAGSYPVLNMPRSEFLNNDNNFSNSLNWIGGLPVASTEATVRHNGSAVFAVAGANMAFHDLTLLEDSRVSTGSNTLDVLESLTIDGAGGAYESRLTVDPGGTVEAHEIRLVNDGQLVMLGGLVAVDRLEIVSGLPGQVAMVPGATLRVDRLIGFGDSLQFAGNLQIGDTGPDTGLLEIGAGQSLWVLGTMTVGPSPGGSATVSVLSGGQADTGSLQIGTGNVSGVVLVSGYDTHLGVLSDWDVSGDLTIGSTSRGAGTMTAQLLATVDVAGAATVRGTSDAVGRLIVRSGASFEVDQRLDVLRFGNVALSDAGSELVADEIALASGGSFSDAAGTIVRANRLSGFGNHVAFSGSLEIGHPGGLASHTVGAGQSLDVAEHFTVGADAPGTLYVGGGTVESGRSYVATEFGASGSSVTVSGSGARWDVLENLYVGGTETLLGGAAALTIANAGQVEVDQWMAVMAGSVVTVGSSSTVGTLTARGTLRIHNGSTVSVETDGNAYADTIDLSGGGNLLTSGNATVRVNHLVGFGSGLSINGNLGIGWSGGGSGVGNVSFINGENLSVSSVLYLGDGATGTLSLVNGGTAQIGQARIGNNGGSGTLVVYRNSSVLSQGGNFYVGYSGAGSTGSMRIENGGAVLGNNHDGFLAAEMGTTGTVLVDGLDARWTDLNSLYVGGHGSGAAGSGTLTVSRSGRVDVNQALRVWNTGRVELLGGEISAASFLVEPGGTFQHDDGTLTVQNGSFDAGASGDYSIDGPSAAELPTVTLTGGASAAISQTLFVGDDHRGQLRLENGATLNSFNGRIGWSTGTSEGHVTVDGANSRWTNAADLEVGVRNVGQLTISNGGRVENTLGAIGAIAGSYGDVVVFGGGRWANSDSLYVGGKFDPGGTGSLVIASDAEVTAANVTVWPQGVIHLDDGLLRTGGLDLVGGRLEGVGDVQLDGPLSNSGVVAPGGSPGLLVLNNGDYLQSAGGMLEIDLSGVHAGEFDRLEVRRGSATLAGGLEVSLFDGFVPPVESVFEILWAEENLSGAFDPAMISFPELPGRQWKLTQRRGTVRLEVLSALLTGDYNQNGVVDADDYTVWRDNLGANIALPNEDPSQTPGWVSPEDYDVWKTHFGDMAGSGSGATAGLPNSESAVPEPAAGVFATVCLLFGGFAHSSRRGERHRTCAGRRE